MNKKPPLMQGSFEKEVQQKLDDLSLQPSPPVWQKIEMQIRLEKKKRRGIFWLLFAGLLFIVGGWWYFNSTWTNEKAISKSQVSNFESSSQKSAPIVNKNISSMNEVKNNPVTTKDSLNYQPAIKETINTQKERTFVSNKSFATKTSTQYTARIKKSYQVNAQIPGDEKTIERKTTRDKINEIQKEDAKALVTKSKPEIISDTMSTQKENSTVLNDSSINMKEEIPKEKLVDSFLKKKVASAKKWRRQMDFTIGSSNAITGLGFEKSLLTADYNSISIGGPTTITLPDTAKKFSAGIAFSAGYNFVKQLSKHWKFSIGIEYAFYSTKIKVGDKLTNDTVITSAMDKMVVDELYTNTSNNSYTNGFHFIELPIQISYQPSAKFPLILSAGASYSYLFATNALTLSRASNRYYKDDDNFHRHQLPLDFSMQFLFNKAKGFSMQTGPLVRYNVTKFQKQSETNRQHLFFVGLKTDISF